MSEQKTNITCEVICDLMVVYASGEASAETIAFIETHLADCPECQEAYEAAQRGEDLLAELEPVEKPINIDGRKILLRLQRVFFGFTTLILLLAIIAIAITERIFIQEILGINLPQLYILGGDTGGVEWILGASALLGVFGLFYYWRNNRARDEDSSYFSLIGAALLLVAGLLAYKFMVQGDLPGTIIAGTLMFALYVFLLRWRVRQKSDRSFGEFLLSLETAVPLFILILAALSLLSSSGFPEGFYALGLVVVALFFTLVQLSELPFMTFITLTALLVGGIMLIGNAAGGVIGLFDLTPNWPAELGHPEELASRFDLAPIGYSHLETGSVSEMDGVVFGSDGKGVQSIYAPVGGRPASVTVIQFSDKDAAAQFVRTWHRRNQRNIFFYSIRLDLNNADFDDPDGTAEHPLRWALEIPGVWFGQEGQIVRSYDENNLKAVNAWQIDEWVTIVEAEGGVAQSIPVSREIKELVAETYR